MGGSLKAIGFGDGCECQRLAKYAPCESRDPERKSWIPASAGMTNTVSAIGTNYENNSITNMKSKIRYLNSING
jgi:hypothetical protein